MFQKKHPRLVSHSFFLPYLIPWTHPSSCTSRLGKVLSSIGGATLRKEARGGNPTIRRQWSPWGFSELFQPKGSTSFGYSRCTFTTGGPSWTWRLWAHAENRLTRSMGQGSLAGTSSLDLSAPWQSILGKQACPGFRDVTAAQVTKAWGE